MSSEKPVTPEYVLKKLSNALSMPGINGCLEDIMNFRWENEFVDHASPEWMEPLFYLYTRPSLIENAVTMFDGEDWQFFAGDLLGQIMRRFPEQMLARVGQMLENSETRYLALNALDAYAEPDALPCYEALAEHTDELSEEEILCLIAGLRSVMFRASKEPVKKEPVKAEAEKLLFYLGRVIPITLTEARQQLGAYGGEVKG